MGNVRLSYSKNSNGSAEVLEENNYYPFGLKHEGYNDVVGNPAYNYQYNGKELQKETGWSDYGARMYMSDIGRWGVIDPLAETSRRFTPYNYALNNPVMFIDPDGRKAQAPTESGSFMYPKSLWGFYASGGQKDHKALMDFIAQNNGWGAFQNLINSTEGGGGGGYTFTGNNATSLFNYFKNGGSMDRISFDNGYAKWWTGTATQTSYRIGDEIYGEGDPGVFHTVRSTGNSSGWGSQAQDSFDAFMNNSFNWIQNHPREFTSIAGTIEGSSQLVAKGLKNWNAPSNIAKSRIFAEVISTRLPASAQALGKFSTALKWGGRAVGAVGLANTFVQWRVGNVSDTRAAIDGAMGVIGFLGPWGAGISLAYFGGMAIYETYYNDGKPAF